jgi:hypothetical protein
MLLVTPMVVDFVGISGQQWTLGSLLAIVFLSVLLGWLRPKSAYKELKDDRDHWRGIALSLLDTNGVLAQGVKETTEPAKAMAETVMTAAQDILGGGRKPDGQ